MKMYGNADSMVATKPAVFCDQDDEWNSIFVTVLLRITFDTILRLHSTQVSQKLGY